MELCKAMAGEAKEMAQLWRQVEELQLALLHWEMKQLLHILGKGKSPMSLELGEIPQMSKPLKKKEPDVDPYVGTSREHEYHKQVFGNPPPYRLALQTLPLFHSSRTLMKWMMVSPKCQSHHHVRLTI